MTRRGGRTTRSGRTSRIPDSVIDADINLVKTEPAEIGHEIEDKESPVDNYANEDEPLSRRCTTRSKTAKASLDSQNSQSQSQEGENKPSDLMENGDNLGSQPIDEIENKPSIADEAEKSQEIFSTVDAANIGIDPLFSNPGNDPLLSNAEPSEAEPPVATKGKRRGRKPKIKKTNDETETNEASTTEPKLRFPQSIVNGIISIDMSSINVKQEVLTETKSKPVPSEKSEDTSSTEKPEKKKRRKSTKKQGEDGEFKIVKARRNTAVKRGRPSVLKDGDTSSAPSSPARPPIKRGRKIKPNTTTRNTTTSKDGNGAYYPYEGLSNILEIEQDEVLQPGDLEGFEDVETLSEKLYLASQNKTKEEEDNLLKLLPTRGLNRGCGRDILQALQIVPRHNMKTTVE